MRKNTKDRILEGKLAMLCNVIESRRFNFVHEAELQDGIEQAFTADGFAFTREHRLGGRDRIDFMFETIGLEVKVDGSPALVLKQLHRYAQSDEVAGLVLVTSRLRHQLPDRLNDKPLRVVTLLAL